MVLRAGVFMVRPAHPNRQRARVKRRSNPPRNRAQVTFRYREQYGVIVICRDEAEQRRIYNALARKGLTVKVVVV